MNVVSKYGNSPDVQSQSGTTNATTGAVTLDVVFAELLSSASTEPNVVSDRSPERIGDQPEQDDKDATDLWSMIFAAGPPQSRPLDERDAMPEIPRKPGVSAPSLDGSSDSEELAGNFVEPSVKIEAVGVATYRSPKSAAVKSSDGSQPSLQARLESTVNSEAIEAAEVSQKGVLPTADAALERTTTKLDSANGANVTLAEGIASQVASAVKDAIAPTQSADVSTTGAKVENAWPITHLRVLDLVLKPEHLGRIEVKMKLSDGGLAMMLTPQSEQTRELLERQLDGLKDTLVGSGYELASISVQSAPASAAPGNAARDGTTSWAGAREGGAFGEPRGGQRGHEQPSRPYHGHQAWADEQQADDKDMRRRTGLYV